METFFLSAKQAFEGGRIATGHGSARIVAGSRDGQVVHTDTGVRLVLRVEPALIHEESMSGLQAEYGGAVRVQGELLRYPSGSVDGSRSFHETPSGPIILVIRVPSEDGDAKKDAKDEAVGGGRLSRGPSEVRTRTEWRLWSGVLLLALVGFFVAVPVVRRSTEEARKTKHLARVRAAAQALLLYAGDNDEKLPPADPLRTVGATTPTESPIEVPEELLGAQLTADGSSERILVRDVRPWPDGKIAVAYADGRAAWVRPVAATSESTPPNPEGPAARP